TCLQRSTLAREAFFGLLGQDPSRLIALKTRVLIKGAVDRIHEVGLVRCSLVMRFAGYRGAEIDDFARVLIDQKHVLIRMGFLLPTVMGGLFRGIRRALAAPLGPIEGPRGGSLQHKRTGGPPAGVSFRGHVESD